MTLGSPVERLRKLGSRRLIVDITSLPKMWFFPIIQAVLQDDGFDDVIVAYTSGTGYSNTLSEHPSPMRVLPGFFADDGRSRHGSIIVGIGFEPLGLKQLLSDQASQKVRLIFPFPSGIIGHNRNWIFVRQIEELIEREQIPPSDRVHIDMYDCPQVFEALCDMTNLGHETSAIAPYGPKTVSLAMCLFALAVASAGLPRVSSVLCSTAPLRTRLHERSKDERSSPAYQWLLLAVGWSGFLSPPGRVRFFLVS